MVLAQPDCSVFDSWLSVESFSRFWLKCFDWLRNKTFFQSSKCFSKNILVSLNFLEIYGQEEMKKEVEFIHGFCSPAPSWESRNTAKLLRRNKLPPASAMCKGGSLTSTTAAPSPSWGSWLWFWWRQGLCAHGRWSRGVMGPLHRQP